MSGKAVMERHGARCPVCGTDLEITLNVRGIRARCACCGISTARRMATVADAVAALRKRLEKWQAKGVHHA